MMFLERYLDKEDMINWINEKMDRLNISGELLEGKDMAEKFPRVDELINDDVVSEDIIKKDIVKEADSMKFINKLKRAYKSMDKEKYPETANMLSSAIENPISGFMLDQFAYDLEACDIGHDMDPNVANIYVDIIGRYARMGDTLALNNLGSFYFNGRNGKVDYKKALKLYEQAHKEGYTLSTENLADMYYYGNGTKVNYEKAYMYYSIACEFGDDQSAMRLGDMFRLGLYVDKDEKRAFYMYMKALNMEPLPERYGNVLGMKTARIADCFYEGIGVDVDKRMAYSLYQRAEVALYEQIEAGDIYQAELLKKVIDRQNEYRMETLEYLQKNYRGW